MVKLKDSEKYGQYVKYIGSGERSNARRLVVNIGVAALIDMRRLAKCCLSTVK